MRRLDWIEGGGDEEERRGLKRRNSRREVLAIHLEMKALLIRLVKEMLLLLCVCVVLGFEKRNLVWLLQ